MIALRGLYLARWNTSNYYVDTAHFIQVYFSDDGGYTWDFLANVGHNGQGYITSDFGLGLTEDPNTGYLYMIALCHYYEHTPFVGLEVFKSEDRGRTWRSVHVFNEYYTYSSYDFATADIAYDPLRNRLIAYYFSEKTRDIVVAVSEDEGQTWTEISHLHPSIHYSDDEGEIEVGPDGIIWIVDWFGSYPECWVSVDGGYTWESHIIDYNVPYYTSIRCASVAYLQPYLYALLWTDKSSATLYRSSDGGRTWERVRDVSTSRASEDGSCALAAQYSWLYAVLWDQSHQCDIYRSVDEGYSWTYVGNIPRREPWYYPASAVAMAVDVLPFDVEEGDSAEINLKVAVSSGKLLIYYEGEVEIFDALGRRLLKKKVPGKAALTLPGGVYYVRGGEKTVKAVLTP